VSSSTCRQRGGHTYFLEHSVERYGDPTVTKKSEDTKIHERDRQTDISWRHRPRLHSIARQK